MDVTSRRCYVVADASRQVALPEDLPIVDTILAPTRSEYAILRRAVASAGDEDRVAALRLGLGPAASARFAQQGGIEPGDRLALVGWAGGLAPDLPPGAIVVATACLDEEGHRARCDALPVLGATFGATLTVPVPLLTAAEKQAAGRQSGAVAVEMEAYPLAEWAADNGVLFSHVRVILDTMHEALPDLDGLVCESGDMAPGWPWRLLARPAMVPTMLRTSLRARSVAPCLSHAVAAICASWRPAGRPGLAPKPAPPAP